jgi:hypothetical protein
MPLTPILPWETVQTCLDLDQREKEFSQLILLSCSMEIEKHCKRAIRERTISEIHDGYLQREIYLREYPVQELISVWYDSHRSFNELSELSKDIYTFQTPTSYSGGDCPSSILLMDDLRFPKGRCTIKVEYTAGYNDETLPDDLKGAFLELVTWTLQRFKTKQIGVNGLINQQGRAVQNTFEKKMPLSVEIKLKPYRRSGLL